MNGNLFNLIFPQMNPAAAVSTGVAHDNINSLMGNGNNLNQRQDENFIKDAFQKFAYNIAARSGGASYMDADVTDLIKFAFTPLKKGEPRYTGGGDWEDISEKWVKDWTPVEKDKNENVDLLSLYLDQKSPSESGMTEQPLRPTDISEKFKRLPTYSIKQHTSQYPLDSNILNLYYQWDVNALRKVSNINEGDVVKLGQDEIGLHPQMDLGGYNVSAGKDDKGTYISIYDVWDFGPDYGRKYKQRSKGISRIQPTLMSMVGKPFAVYDRYYIPQEQFKSELKRREEEESKLQQLMLKMDNKKDMINIIQEVIYGKKPKKDIIDSLQQIYNQ